MENGKHYTHPITTNILQRGGNFLIIFLTFGEQGMLGAVALPNFSSFTRFIAIFFRVVPSRDSL
jgi:hypothetical protein